MAVDPQGEVSLRVEGVACQETGRRRYRCWLRPPR